MLQNFGQTRTLPQKFGVFKKLQEFLNFYGVLWQILLEFGKYSIFQSYLEFYFKYSWWNFFLEYCISKLRNSDQVTGPIGYGHLVIHFQKCQNQNFLQKWQNCPSMYIVISENRYYLKRILLKMSFLKVSKLKV